MGRKCTVRMGATSNYKENKTEQFANNLRSVHFYTGRTQLRSPQTHKLKEHCIFLAQYCIQLEVNLNKTLIWWNNIYPFYNGKDLKYCCHLVQKIYPFLTAIIATWNKILGNIKQILESLSPNRTVIKARHGKYFKFPSRIDSNGNRQFPGSYT